MYTFWIFILFYLEKSDRAKSNLVVGLTLSSPAAESNMKHMLHACLPKGIVHTKVVAGCWTMQRKPQVVLQLKVRLCVHWQLTNRKKWTSRQVYGDTNVLCVSNKNLVGVGVKARLCRDQKCYAIWSWVKECPWHFLGSNKSVLAERYSMWCLPLFLTYPSIRAGN